jgi:ATP-dependent Clp protease protease subunit
MRPISTLLIAALAFGPAAVPAGAAPKPAPSREKKIDPLAKEKAALEKVTIQNQIRKAKTEAEDYDRTRKLELLRYGPVLEKAEFEQRLKSVVAEKEELAIRYALELEKLKKELQSMELEQNRLETKQKLENVKFQAQISALRQERETLMLENQVSAEKSKKELEVLKGQKDRAQLELEVKLLQLREEKELLKAQNDRKTEQLRKATLEAQAERERIDMELKRMALEQMKLKFETDKKQNALAKLRSEIDIRQKKHEWKDEANKEPEYLKDPYKDGVLTISDRRIDLTGPIYGAIGTRVTERIQYFNNVSKDPIFLVVDASPGGSVVSGARILAAMKKSEAPVYVVLKSFAASMAAIIVSSADRSYSLPNAIMLHHEPWGFMIANTSQLKEELEWLKKWEKRLFHPLAKKFGYSSMEKFRKAMYANSSNGDWKEFADDAVKLKWVNRIVREIRETGIVKNPDAKKKTGSKNRFLLEEQTDDQGKRFVRLPRISPVDAYMLYDPDNYYR